MAFPWTDDIREEMKELWADGKSASQIAMILAEKYDARLSRNAIIGAIHRLGRKVRDKLRPPGPQKKKKKKKAKTPSLQALQPVEPIEPVEPVKPVLPVEPEPVPMNVSPHDLKPTIESIMDLGVRHCRWPYGEDNFTYRGRTRVSGSPYCCAHHKLSRRPDRYAKRPLGHSFPPALQGDSIVVKGPEQQGGQHHRQRPTSNNKSRFQWFSTRRRG